MDLDFGKTFRRVPDFRRAHGKIFVNSNQQLEIFGNEFIPCVSYSIKKRKRWEILPFISKTINFKNETEFDEDLSIRCCIRQEQESRSSQKAHYLIDSDVRKEIGSMNLSHHKFNKGSFNLNSVMKNWEQSVDQTENDLYPNKTNSNWQSIVDKVLENNFISKESFTSMLNEELLLKETNERNYICIDECIPNNSPYCTKPRLWRPNRRTKRDFKNLDFDDFSVNHVENVCNVTDDEENDIILDEFLHESQIKKPIVFSEKDSVIISKPKTKKRKRYYRKNIKNSDAIDANLENFKSLSDKQDSEILKNNKLPRISITLPLESFKEELKTISGFCHCWMSITSPEMILIDVDYISNLFHKNYVILKPVCVNNDDLFSVVIIFNLFNYNFSKVLDKVFTSVVELVTFIQSTIDQIEDFGRLDKKRNLLTLTNPIENLSNTWNTEIIETTKSIFYFNNEWKEYEFQQDRINFENLSNMIKEKSKCEICFDNVAIDEVYHLKACQHRICEKCFLVHLMNLLNINSFSFDCPINECHSAVDCVSVLSLIPFKEYQKTLEYLENSVIKNIGCQCIVCNSILIKSKLSNGSYTIKCDYLCKCGTKICGLCGNQQHWPASCYDMVKHDKQIKKLNDKYVPQISTSVKVEGIFCSNCRKFFPKTDNFIWCSCLKPFCYIDGKIDHENCCPDNRKVVFKINVTKHDHIFKPDSFRPKFYCESIKIRFSLQPSNISLLKGKLIKIDSAIKNNQFLDIDRASVISQYQQILKVIESIYVFQYQSNDKSSTKSLILIKSVQNLMFFVREFQAIIDQLNSSMCKNPKTQISTTEILRKRERLTICMNNAMNIIKKCYNLIH